MKVALMYQLGPARTLTKFRCSQSVHAAVAKVMWAITYVQTEELINLGGKYKMDSFGKLICR